MVGILLSCKFILIMGQYVAGFCYLIDLQIQKKIIEHVNPYV